MLETIKQNISEAHHLKILDLYQEKFDPVLYFDNENKRRDLQFDPTTQHYRDDLVWANHLIFIYPIWWSSMPAILKGYIDRVFAKGFAYEYKGINPVPLLPNKTATIITTHDTPCFYVRLVQKDYGKILNKQILNMCGIKTTDTLTMSFLRNADENKRARFLEKLSKYAKTL